MQSFDETEPHQVREITEEEILEQSMPSAKRRERAAEAGFDGVEIHGANHYIIHQFVSPHFNQRTDQWGQDRYLFAEEVVKSVLAAKRKHAGNDFIVGYRFLGRTADTGIDMEIAETLIGKLKISARLSPRITGRRSL